MSTELSLGIMAICLLVSTLATLAVSLVLVLVLLRVRKSITTLTNRAQPLISQATEIAKTANGVAQNVKGHVEGIMNKAEDTVDNVTRKVRTTTNVLQESISPPMITVGSLLTGVSKGLEVWTHLKRKGGNGHAGP